VDQATLELLALRLGVLAQELGVAPAELEAMVREAQSEPEQE
jgi:hypothetical protein